MNDAIVINRLCLQAHIGTSTEERASPQSLVISMRIEIPLKESGRSDDLRQSVDYASIVEMTRTLFRESRFNLVEAAAESLASKVLLHEPVLAVWIKVEKKPFDDVESVGVEIWRSRN